MAFIDGTSIVISVKVDNNGVVTLVGSTTSATVATLTTGVWYCVELRVTSNGTSYCRVNFGTEQSATANNVTQNRLAFGTDATATYNAFYDDWYIDDAVYQGELQVFRLDVTGDGALGTGWATGSGTGFAEVDEIPHDTDTTYWGSALVGDVWTVTVETAGSASAFGPFIALLSSIIARDEGGVSALATRLRSGSTNNDTSDANLSTTYAVRTKVYLTDPATSAAWTLSAVNVVEVGAINNAVLVATRVSSCCVMAVVRPIHNLAAMGAGI